jgi:hypothetical protein
MTGTEFKTIAKFELALASGTKVLARWTNSFRFYACPATVVKVNSASVIVTLDEAITDGDKLLYPAGKKIKCPLWENMRGWSANNRVEPAGGYGG